MEKILIAWALGFIALLSSCTGRTAANVIELSATETKPSYTWSTATRVPATPTQTRAPTLDFSEVPSCGVNARLQSCPDLIVPWLTERLNWGEFNQIANLVSNQGVSFAKWNTDFAMPFASELQFAQALEENLAITQLECLGYTTGGKMNGFLEIYYTGVTITLDYFQQDMWTDILLFGFNYEKNNYYLVAVGPMHTEVFEPMYSKNPLASCPQ